MKPDGSIYSTWFTFQSKTEAVAGTPRRLNKFPEFHGDFALSNPEIPEDAIAYRLEFILERATLAKLKPRTPIIFASQDAIIFIKA